MWTINDVVFKNENVSMDGKYFCDCLFQDCVLEYSGMELTLENTEFRGCRVKLTGAGGRALQFLQCLGMDVNAEGKWDPPAEKSETFPNLLQ